MKLVRRPVKIVLPCETCEPCETNIPEPNENTKGFVNKELDEHKLIQPLFIILAPARQD